jgi:hypothetical protein
MSKPTGKLLFAYKTISNLQAKLEDWEADANLLEAERDTFRTDNQRLREALEQIAGWQSHSLPFAVDFGLIGVRDFYRDVARAALTTANGEVT